MQQEILSQVKLGIPLVTAYLLVVVFSEESHDNLTCFSRWVDEIHPNPIVFLCEAKALLLHASILHTMGLAQTVGMPRKLIVSNVIVQMMGASLLFTVAAL